MNCDHHILEELYGPRPGVKTLYHNQWSGYEEHGYVFILEINGQYHELRGGHSVMAEDNSNPWDPQPVSEDEALKTMLDWDEWVAQHEREMCF